MTPPPYEELRTALLGTTSDGLVRWRLVIVLLLNVITLGVLASAGFPLWRLALVAVFGGGSLLWQLVRFVRWRLGQQTQSATIYVSLLVNLLLQAGIIALTGGPFSPYIPFLFPIFVSVLVTFGRGRRSRSLLGLVTLRPLAFAAMPALWTDIPLPRLHCILLALAAQLTSVQFIYTHVLAVTDAYVRAGDTLGRMGTELLADVRARSKSLELVGTKMAHELKNPLSAIKGLAQLLTQGAPDERTRERLAVIDGEVSRMEEILRGYLSFSHSLEELRPRPLDLTLAVDDAVAVLEGRAQEAGVSVGCEGVWLVGDAQRLKEALLNLLSKPRHPEDA